MAETKKQRYERLRADLATERASFDAHWKELAQHFNPRGAQFSTSESNRGDKRSQKIIDTTPVLALRTLSAGMMSGITSPARPWFRLTVDDVDLAESASVKAWLHTVTQRMGTVFSRSNLYKALPKLYESMGCFATGAMSVEEDDRTVINCRNYPVGQYYIANDHREMVRTFVRVFPLTVAQVVEQFGERNASGEIINWDTFSNAVRDSYTKNHRQRRLDVVHVVQANEQFDPNRLHSRFKPFASCYYELGAESDKFLLESGFDEFPVLCGRWDVTAGDVYGTNCPGITALADVKQLQYGEKMSAEAITKMVRPPMVANEAMRATAASILSGGITYVPDGSDVSKSFRPAMEVDFGVTELENKQAQIRARVDRAHFVDLFLMLANDDRKQITATEIIERKEEKLLALGPMLEALNQDVLDPLIDRTFAIMLRRGLIPDAPEELQGAPLKVEYISVMAQAQKALGRSGLEAFIGFGATLAKATGQWPEKIDVDQSIDEYAEMTGVPPRVVVPDEQVQAMRDQKAKQMQMQQEAEMLAKAGPGAKALSETDVQGPNALTALVNGATQPTAQQAA